MADKTTPLCKDCKHFRGAFRVCRRTAPRNVFDPLFGETTRLLHEAATTERRKRGFFEFGKPRCGPEGRYFEAIEPPAGGSAVYSGIIAAHTHNVAAAESTIERYSRYAQEMKQIRKDELED